MIVLYVINEQWQTELFCVLSWFLFPPYYLRTYIRLFTAHCMYVQHTGLFCPCHIGSLLSSPDHYYKSRQLCVPSAISHSADSISRWSTPAKTETVNRGSDRERSERAEREDWKGKTMCSDVALYPFSFSLSLSLSLSLFLSPLGELSFTRGQSCLFGAALWDSLSPKDLCRREKKRGGIKMGFRTTASFFFVFTFTLIVWALFLCKGSLWWHRANIVTFRREKIMKDQEWKTIKNNYQYLWN